MKKRIKKKGQAEDFLADLIPSLIIIAIGLFVLSKMNSENQKIVDERGKLLAEALKGEKMMSDYLFKPIKLGNKKMDLEELISLSYKNENYQKEVEGHLKSIHLIDISPPPDVELPVCQYRMCLSSKIKYPDGSSLIIEDELCKGEEKTLNFPSYEGNYITLTYTLDKTIRPETCSSV